MGVYSKKTLLPASASQIPQIAESIRQEFANDNFDVKVDNLLSGGYDISITNGNLFKAVLGLKTALKVTLIPQQGGVLFEANVGVFGQQVVPTIISMFFLWPVLITQIWGLVKQASLDDRALRAAERVLSQPTTNAAGLYSSASPTATTKFCPNCGTRADGGKFCSNCGHPLS